MTVFKIYINGISDGNLIFRSDVSTALTGYGDTILSPKLKKETNKADSFEFMILPSHEKYGSFEKKKTFVFLTRDDKCIFRGRVSDVKTDIYKQRTITCEGDLAFLADSIQPPNKKNETSSVGSTKKKKNATVYSIDGGRTYTVVNNKDTLKMTPEAYFRTCIDVHNGQVTNDNKKFTVGSVTVTDKSKNDYFERTSYQDTSSVISSDLLSVYGGVLRTRYENGQAYIDWLGAYTETNSQEIRFGVNMIDLDQEPPTDEIWSVLLPTGEENCTIESKNNGSKFLENSDAIEQYGYIVHHHAFSNVKKADELLTKARKYMSTHCKIFPNNLVIKAIDLQLIGESTDPLELGDKIKVVSSPHGLNKTMACIAMELDIYNPENNSYTIGTILPPDKEKKKEPLSEKHKNSHGSSSRGIANNANAISGLQNDVNVNANNINVNAENIAVNALNIAVNAENIAVVAKNISIAAETIDIKAQEITATFGEETDELYGHITASAEGIKTEFHNNTTGLSSYFTQEADRIVAAVRSAKGDIESKIEVTENGITQAVNSKIYGENGVVSDYESKIEVSKTSIMASVIGEDANPSDASTWKSGSLLKMSRDYIYAALFGGGSDVDPSNPSTWDLGSYLGLSRNKLMLAVFGSAEWGNRKSLLEVTNEGISSKVSKDGVISSINQTAESVTISASKINLSGYVTVDKLSAVDGNIANLVNGNTTASYILATKMKVATGNFYIGDNGNKSGKFYYHGTEYYDVTLTMPNVPHATNGFLGWAYQNNAYQTSISLAHSHSVTTNTDGTITIGGTVATDATNRSFKIADTKAYKDGVSAISVTSVGLNTTDYEDSGIGTAATSNTPIYYTSSDKNYHVRVRADASNGNHREKRIDFSGELAYNAGYNDGQPASWSIPNYSSTYDRQMVATADDSDGVKDCVNFKVNFIDNTGASHPHTFTKIPCWDVHNDGQAIGKASVSIDSLGRNSSYSDSYDSTTHDTTVYIKATASNGATRSTNFTVSGSSAFNTGAASVYINSLDINSNSTVSYDSSTKKYSVPIKATTNTLGSKTNTVTIDATSAYNHGYNDVTASSVSISEITPRVGSSGRNDEGKATVHVQLDNGKGKDFEIDHIVAWKVYDQGRVDAVDVPLISCNTVRVYKNGTAAVWIHVTDSYGNDHSKRLDVPANGVTVAT